MRGCEKPTLQTAYCFIIGFRHYSCLTGAMRMKTITYSLSVLTICLVGAGPLFAQKENKKKDPIEVRINLAVRNADGANVSGLRKEDIKIFESGDAQTISDLAEKDPKINLAIVADNTGSMRSSLPFISSIARQLIDGLAEKDEALIVRFVSSDNIALLSDWSSDKRALQASLSQMYIEGGQSAVLDALYSTANHMIKRAQENRSQRFAMVLISDCEDRASGHSQQELFDKLRESGIQVFVIGLTAELSKEPGFVSASPFTRAEYFANRVVLGTGGAAYLLSNNKKDTRNIDELIRPLLEEIRSQYVISYTSTNTGQNDKPRKLRVEIAPGKKGEVRTGFIRDGFVVPKE